MELILVQGHKLQVPDELWEYLYKKEFGITTHEYLDEPRDRIEIFKKIKQCEFRKAEKDNKK